MTIYNIETGLTRQPSPAVLRSLAHGLVADPLDGSINEEKAEWVYEDLLRAADYLPRHRPNGRDGSDDDEPPGPPLNAKYDLGTAASTGVQGRVLATAGSR